MNNVQDKYERRSQVGTGARHDDLATRLIAAAEATIAAHGLPELRARDLARAAGCSVGAIYAVFPTLDALVMAVNDRTLAAMQQALERRPAPGTAVQPAEELAQFAAAYLAFAAEHRNRWAALFEHRLAPGQSVTPEYEARQSIVFARVAVPIGELCPALSAEHVALWARTLFSAVHGVVLIGLEEKLALVPRAVLEQQLRDLVTALAAGLGSQRGGK